MAGKTPPERRTTLCVPMPSIPACQMEDEPDIMESKGFGDGLNRFSELKRRNTLCLPHMKSSYPLEVIEAENVKTIDDAVYEATVRNAYQNSTNPRKRKSEENRTKMPAKRSQAATGKRVTSASNLTISKDTSMRNVKSDSSIVTRSMLDQGSQMIWGDSSRIKDESLVNVTNNPRRESVAFTVSFDEPNKKLKAMDSSSKQLWGDATKIKEETSFDITSDPRRESVAFSVDFDEPNKKLKPRASMRRAQGSAHLMPTASTESLYSTQEIRAAKTSKKENQPPNKNKPDNTNKPDKASATPLKRSNSDKTSFKSRTNNLRKSIRKSISSKVRGSKATL